MIAIVDYGIGNLGSVTKAFRHVGAETVLSGDPQRLLTAVLGEREVGHRRVAPVAAPLGLAVPDEEELGHGGQPSGVQATLPAPVPEDTGRLPGGATMPSGSRTSGRRGR